MFYPDRGPWSDRWNGVGLAGKTRAQVLREYGLPVAITANQRGLLFSGSDLDQEPRIIVVFDEGGVVARSILVEHDAYAELRAAVADSQSKECSPAPASR
jgi:hypothetical protein